MQRKMYGKKFISILLCAVMTMGIPALMTSAADTFTVTSEGKSTLSAILINDGGQYSEINYDYNDIRGNNEGDNWTYTINVEAAGTYNIKVLGSSGWNDWSNDANGRFKLEIGETVIENGTAVLPAIGGGGEGQSKDWGTFTEADALDLGNFELESGIQTMKVTVITPGMALGVMFKNFYFTPVIEEKPGTPYNGTAPNIIEYGLTAINAAEKNTGATCDGGEVNNDGTYYDIRGKVAGEGWVYTVNVPKAGCYNLEVLGSSRYETPTNSTVGKFTLAIDENIIVDGKSENAFVMPYSGDKASGENKRLDLFTDTDRVSIGNVYLSEGEHIMKITIDVPDKTFGVFFKKFYFTSVDKFNTVFSVVENNQAIVTVHGKASGEQTKILLAEYSEGNKLQKVRMQNILLTDSTEFTKVFDVTESGITSRRLFIFDVAKLIPGLSTPYDVN